MKYTISFITKNYINRSHASVFLLISVNEKLKKDSEIYVDKKYIREFNTWLWFGFLVGWMNDITKNTT